MPLPYIFFIFHITCRSHYSLLVRITRLLVLVSFFLPFFIFILFYEFVFHFGHVLILSAPHLLSGLGLMLSFFLSLLVFSYFFIFPMWSILFHFFAWVLLYIDIGSCMHRFILLLISWGDWQVEVCLNGGRQVYMLLLILTIFTSFKCKWSLADNYPGSSRFIPRSVLPWTYISIAQHSIKLMLPNYHDSEAFKLD